MTVVTPEDTVDEWRLEHSTITGVGHRLVLTSPGGPEWAAEASDVFECLMVLRERVEPQGIRLCCNGSRLDAWASGMQRDMGSGFSVYLLAGVAKGQRAPTADTLEFAPPELIAKVAEQRAWYDAWLNGGAPSGPPKRKRWWSRG